MMDITLDGYTRRLAGLLQKKKEHLQEILKLTEAQETVINEDGISELQKLIEKKQLVIEEIDKLDDEFAVYFSRLKISQKVKSLDELDMSGVDGARELKNLTVEVVRIIKEIQKLEKLNEEKSKALLGRFGGELKKISQGKMVNNAYAPVQLKAPSYFIDKKK